MAAYAKRHYGYRSNRVIGPNAIVEHWTEGDSVASAFNTFAANTPDPELHELPGTCAHFVIARDGTIFQLVPITRMCRHAFGMNWTAIGIEHVGRSDAEIIGNARQLAASIRLTSYLRCRYDIAVSDVVGHAETYGSKWFRDLDRAALPLGPHSDLGPRAMGVYRRLLARRGCA